MRTVSSLNKSYLKKTFQKNKNKGINPEKGKFLDPSNVLTFYIF